MSTYQIKAFYDEDTATVTYVVYDPASKDSVVIDPVLDYDMAASKTFTKSCDALEAFIRAEKLTVHFAIETHAHADHLSGAPELKKRFPNLKTAINRRITEVQEVFKNIYNLPDSFIPNGKQFDFLLDDKQILKAGTMSIEVRYTPGHTPACTSFLIGDAVFTGDALFMPDTGTGRCDFPRGSSTDLFESISTQLYSLPDSTRVFVGHDYKAQGTREANWESTIGEEKLKNIQLKSTTAKNEYVEMRNARDSKLSAPRLLLPSIQVNINAGQMPTPEANGVSYLKIPIKAR